MRIDHVSLPLICSSLLLGSFCSSVSADYTLKVTPPSSTPGSRLWEGWGTSLCWWANVFGDREDVADLFFSSSADYVTIKEHNSPLPALRLNIVRYNIGGSGDNVIGSLSMKKSPKAPAFKGIETFWVDGLTTPNVNTSDPTQWNWEVDTKQRKSLSFAKEKGVNLFEAFSNSSPWWMNYNLATAGSDSGGDNLQKERYQQFALYLAEVVSKARSEWGIDFQYVNPFNEPSERWWRFPQTQEGCHFDYETQKSVISALRQELDVRGLSTVALSASDENSMDAAVKTWDALFSSPSFASVAKVNVHGYSGLSPYRGWNRKPLRNRVVDTGRKRLWMSEYGDPDNSGMSMADSITRDLNELQPTAWIYWQVLDSGGWGVVQSNPGDNWIGPANPKYFVLAQFTRHIRPGMEFLTTTDHNTVAAYDRSNKRLIFVTVNYGRGQWVNYNLAQFSKATGPIVRWATDTSGKGDLYKVYSNDTIMQSNKLFWSYFTKNTVQTFEVEGVEL